MSTRTTINPQLSEVSGASRAVRPTGGLAELIALATRGLVPMFDQDKQIFCHRLLQTEQGIRREGLSPRYTIMTLLGLQELELAGIPSPFDIRAIYASFARDTNWIQGLGDLGLLLWLTVAFDPASLADVLSKFGCETALDRYTDAQAARTMELAWFLAGLAHAAQSSPQLHNNLTNLSERTYRRLRENQGACGLFGHLGTKNSFAGRLRGRIGSFADQVYPIYAMSKYSQAFRVDEALSSALACAGAICGAQGELGQWWWLYDSHNGRVSCRYPVYSVHQHGMAPMALLALDAASGKNFDESIHRGLRWLSGANELGRDMIDRPLNLVWRCVLPENKLNKYWEIASSRIFSSKPKAQAASLKILYEQRPYEYGWLLFAFARKAGSEPDLRDA